MDDDWHNISGLKDREVNVIRIIDNEDLAYFTFEGLKRLLRIHPETLSRILNRLTEDEILKKTNDHYTLTSKVKGLLETQNPGSNNPNLLLFQSLLPPQLPTNKIISNLKCKWFGTLRWLGYSTKNKDVALRWITDDGAAIVSAIFSQGILSIYVKMISENDFNSAINASYQLMGYITKLISKTQNN